LVEAILDAAARILVQRGRDAVTTNSVAVIAGVSIGSLYQYFPNREAIIAAVADRHAHRIHHCVAAVDLRAVPSLEHAVRRIVAALFDAHRIDPALHRALDHDLSPGHVGHAPAHGHAHGHGHLGTKPAIVRLISTLPDTLKTEIRSPDPALAGEVVAEVIHTLAHAAMHPSKMNYASGSFESEAVRVALSYLRSPT
jgi:AcrR family transcriptional regulator